MIIREIHIDGFGGLRSRKLELTAPLTVIYGPNEAGKSTVMQWIRAVLFGFPPRGQADRFEPLDGGTHGGALVLETEAGERIRVARRFGGPGAKGRGPTGMVAVTLADGTTGGEELLGPLLGGITGEQFNNLFAFSLSELQELRTLTGNELGGFLYNAGLGVRASVVVSAERRLATELDARFKPKGRNQEMSRLLASIDGLEAELRRSKALAGQFNEMSAELSRLTAAIEATEDELRLSRNRHRFLEAAAGVYDHWLRRESILRELQELPRREQFPAGGIARQDALLQEIEGHGLRLKEQEARIGKLRVLLAERPERDAELLARRPELSQLSERLAEYRSGLIQAAELRTELAQVEEQLERLFIELGAGWGEESLADPNAEFVTFQHKEEARLWKEQHGELERRKLAAAAEREDAERKLQEALQKRRERQEEKAAYTRRMGERLPMHPEAWARTAMEAVREIRREIGRKDRLEQEIRLGEEWERELSLLRMADSHGGQRGSSSGVLLLFGGWSVLTGAGLGAWLLRQGEPGAAIVVFAVLTGIAAAAVVLGRSDSNGPARDRKRSARPYAEGPAASVWDEQKRTLQLEAEACRLRIQELYRSAAGHPEASAALAAAERAGQESDDSLLERLEQWAAACVKAVQELGRLEDRVREGEQGVQASEMRLRLAEQRIGELDDEEKEMLNSWGHWLSRWSWGREPTEHEGRKKPHFLPSAGVDWLRLLDQAHQAYRSKVRLKDRLQQLEEQTASFESAVAGHLGPATAADPVLTIRQRQLETEEAAERERSIQEADKSLAAAEEEEESLRQAVRWAKERLLELWSRSGASDEEEFRSHAAEQEKLERLEAELRSLEDLLTAAAHPRRMEELTALFGGGTRVELEEACASAEQETARQELKIQELRDAKGRLAGELDRMLQGTEHGDLIQQLEEEKARFREQAGEWAVLAMAAGLFRSAREAYERERQPGVLKQASAHFAHLTNGRYKRIMAPVGEKKLLAEHADGSVTDSVRLSRGTAEQLYLAMRFALAEEFARKAALPLVLDDLFVNFDRERLEAAVTLAARLSEGHQVLLFTCHNHVLETVQHVHPQAGMIRLW